MKTDKIKAGVDVSDVECIPGFSVDADIAVNSGPICGLAVTTDGTRLVVTHQRDNSVSVIDTGSCAVVATIPGIDEPFAVATGSAGGRYAYVSAACAAYDAIAVIDIRANTVTAAHPVAFGVTDLTVSPDGKSVYASRTGADVVVLDTATEELGVIDIAAAPGTSAEQLRISADGRRLCVATHTLSGSELVVIDTGVQQVIARFEIGAPIRDVALSPNGDAAYVLSCGPDFGAVIDIIDTRANSFLSTVKVGEIEGLVTQLVLSGAGDRAYLVSDGGVAVLCTLTQDVIGTVTLGRQPSCVVESPDRNRLYVADYSGGVAVVSTASLVSGDEDVTAGNQWPLAKLPALEPAMA